MSYGYRHDDDWPTKDYTVRQRTFSRWLGDQWEEWIWPLLKFVIVVLLIGWGMVSCVQSDWNQKREREAAAQRRAEETPHVIREFDGCKVYTFKAGERWHYFTRCPGSPTKTDSTYEVRHGKTTSTESESIEVR